MFGRGFKRVLFCLLTSGVSILLQQPLDAVAEDGAPPVQVVHRPPDLQNLAPTVAWLPVVAELRNTKDVGLKVRLVGSRDGRLIDITLPKGNLNVNDYPEYRVEIPAPVAAMSYQFVVHQPDGSLATSQRFAIRRACVQNYRIEIPDNGGDVEFKRSVGELVSRAKSLERETLQLDASLKVVEELKKNIPGS
jgi:hypothetical protein